MSLEDMAKEKGMSIKAMEDEFFKIVIKLKKYKVGAIKGKYKDNSMFIKRKLEECIDLWSYAWCLLACSRYRLHVRRGNRRWLCIPSRSRKSYRMHFRRTTGVRGC